MRQITINNYKKFAWHLLFWVTYIIYLGIDEDRRHDTLTFSLALQDVTDVPVIILVVYINLNILMPYLYAREKYAKYIFAVLILMLIDGLANRFFSWKIWLPRERLLDLSSREPTEFWILPRIFKDTFEDIPVLGATILIKLMHGANQREKKLREMEKEKFRAEMGLLKAQINPHFFFNTLNSLYALTLSGSKQASQVVLRLSDLMRYMLYEASANKVLLMDEINHLQNYISIEQMRFADRLELSLQYSGDIEGKMIAPLLLLPFVENAFKHGITNNTGWITIDLKVTGSILFLKVENSYTTNSKPATNGLGLNNVKRRLELIYQDAYELLIRQNDDLYTVDLKLHL